MQASDNIKKMRNSTAGNLSNSSSHSVLNNDRLEEINRFKMLQGGDTQSSDKIVI